MNSLSMVKVEGFHIADVIIPIFLIALGVYIEKPLAKRGYPNTGKIARVAVALILCCYVRYRFS